MSKSNKIFRHHLTPYLSSATKSKIQSYTDPNILFKQNIQDQHIIRSPQFWYKLSKLQCQKQQYKDSIEYLKDGYIRTYRCNNINYVHYIGPSIAYIRNCLFQKLQSYRDIPKVKEVLEQYQTLEEISNANFKSTIKQLQKLLKLYRQMKNQNINYSQFQITIDLDDNQFFLDDLQYDKINHHSLLKISANKKQKQNQKQRLIQQNEQQQMTIIYSQMKNKKRISSQNYYLSPSQQQTCKVMKTPQKHKFQFKYKQFVNTIKQISHQNIIKQTNQTNQKNASNINNSIIKKLSKQIKKPQRKVKFY